jgi:hypothetical protein
VRVRYVSHNQKQGKETGAAWGGMPITAGGARAPAPCKIPLTRTLSWGSAHLCCAACADLATNSSYTPSWTNTRLPAQQIYAR